MAAASSTVAEAAASSTAACRPPAACPDIRAQRVTLCWDPGVDGAPLCSLVGGRRAASRRGLQTWGMNDERVSELRTDMPKWISLCSSLPKVFGRGVNRKFLAKAYQDRKIGELFFIRVTSSDLAEDYQELPDICTRNCDLQKLWLHVAWISKKSKNAELRMLVAAMSE